MAAKPTIHPEHSAGTFKLAADVGRIAFNYGEELPPLIDALMRLLPLAEACKVFKPGKLKKADLENAHLRRDARFWRQLLENHVVPVLTFSPRTFDDSLLHKGLGRLWQGAIRGTVGSAAATFGRTTTRSRDRICIIPTYDGGGELIVFARPERIGAMAVRAEEVLCSRMPAKEAREWQTIDVAWVRKHRAHILLIDFDPLDEPRIVRILKAAGKSPTDRQKLRDALAIAEIVAMSEGRGEPPEFEWKKDMRESVEKVEPVDVATVTLAMETVGAIVKRGAWVRDQWLTEEARAEATEDLHDLEKRLTAAVAARRARANAPNAPAERTTKRSADELVRPERFRTQIFYALLEDAAELLEFARGSGATLLVQQGSELAELPAWQKTDAVLAKLLPRFDDRTLEHRLSYWEGLRVLLWWKDISEEPTLLYVDPEEPEALLRPLMEFMLPIRASYEPIGWGFASLFFTGASQGRIFESTFEYPTGTELSLRRYEQDGPWRRVDWRALKRKVSEIRRHMDEMTHAVTIDRGRRPILAHAAATLPGGHTVTDRTRTPMKTRPK